MVGIGIVGIGFMGMIHFLATKKLRGARVTAVVSRDPKKRAGDWNGIQGNFGPRGKVEDLSGIHAYASLEELLDDPDVTLVDICLPNDGHADAAVAALRAGKDVMVEKPIALSLADADRMVAAARDAGRRLLVAHVLPFFPEFGFALEAVQSGKFGRLRAAHFRRHISPPDWSTAIGDAQRTGGPILDLHVHDTHFVTLACGMPVAVQSRGLIRDGAVVYVATQYLFDDGGPVVTATSGAIASGGRPFTHGYEIYLDRATLFFEEGSPLALITTDGVSHPKLPSSDPIDCFANEMQCAIDALAEEKPAGRLEGDLARTALALCLKEAESVQTGKTVTLG